MSGAWSQFNEDILDEFRALSEPLVKLAPPDERLRKPREKLTDGGPLPLLDSGEGAAKPSVQDPRPDAVDLRALNLNPREAKIYSLLDAAEARGIDHLIQESALQPQEVLSTLLVLEVRRLCRQLPGKRFVKGS